MDPQACMQLILGAIGDGNREDAEEHLGNLMRWLSNGGFAPDYAQALCDYVDGMAPMVDDHDESEDESDEEEGGE